MAECMANRGGKSIDRWLMTVGITAWVGVCVCALVNIGAVMHAHGTY